MKLLWLADPHLNFLDESGLTEFIQKLKSRCADAILISGDIAEAPTLLYHLTYFNTLFRIPIYFILGNHDYYSSSRQRVREKLTKANATLLEKNLIWLEHSNIRSIQLTDEVGLVGVGCLGDARYGSPDTSKVLLTDFTAIDDFSGKNKIVINALLNRWGEEAAEFLNPRLQQSVAKYKNTIVLLHAPPFRDAALFEGKPSGNDYVPYFACKAVGDVILKVAHKTSNNITVLCGHTHYENYIRPEANLEVYVGEAAYGKPVIRDIVLDKTIVVAPSGETNSRRSPKGEV